jgi:DNA-binding PadR family transcriptional regulator
MEKGLVTAVERNRRKLFVITAKGEAITAKVEDLFQGRVVKPFEALLMLFMAAILG